LKKCKHENQTIFTFGSEPEVFTVKICEDCKTAEVGTAYVQRVSLEKLRGILSNKKNDVELDKPKGLLHIYGQGAWHEEAYVVGNRESLTALKGMIDKALETTDNQTGAFWVNDGEGFHLYLVLIDGDWESEKWKKLITPYTENIAGDKLRETIKPYELIKLSEGQK